MKKVKKMKKKKKKSAYQMLEIGLIVIFLISAALIYPDIAERIRAMRQNNEIQQTGPTSAQDETGNTPQATISELKKINSDMIGWIYIDGTNINYPIVQHTDNDYYLTHLYNNEPNSAGSIFMDYQNDAAFSDQNTLIYGHSRLDGTMFAQLRKLKEQSFVDQHPNITIYTETETAEYKIISVNVVSDTYNYRSLDIGNNLETYIESMIQSSCIQTDTAITDTDKIITLSTCTNVIEDGRLIVIAKLI